MRTGVYWTLVLHGLESEGPTRGSWRHGRLIDAERQLPGFPEAMVGQFEERYVAFEGVQDQDVLDDSTGKQPR